jgi:hypothetical protein
VNVKWLTSVKKEAGTEGFKKFGTTKTKIGKNDEVLFSKPSYNALGDPYQDAKYNLRGGRNSKPATTGTPFKPSGGPK